MANTSAKPAAKSPDKKDPVPIVHPAGTEPVKTADLEPLDHGDKRAYQTDAEPGSREYLTKEEAQKRGFHWAEDVGDKSDKKKKR